MYDPVRTYTAARWKLYVPKRYFMHEKNNFFPWGLQEKIKKWNSNLSFISIPCKFQQNRPKKVAKGINGLISSTMSPSLAAASPPRQTYQKCFPHLQTRNQKGYHLLPPSARQVTNPQKLMAHCNSTLQRLCSYFQHIGHVKFANAISPLQKLK